MTGGDRVFYARGMCVRRRPIQEPVELLVDGERVAADRGEPVAAALLAAGRSLFGRSVKYHRPRGPLCLEGRCDGCLMRVDGVPNVMSCRVGAEDGMRVETQNVLGSARVDLLAVTDWFFPEGMDHHHMFTRFGPINRLMQKVARRIAGVGRLPDAAASAVAPRELDVDVLVVGGGRSGIVAANAAAREGASVLLVEEQQTFGGEAGLLGESVPVLGPPVDARRGVGAVAVYQEPAVGFAGREPTDEAVRWVLLEDAEGLLRVRCGSLVVATGTDPVPPPIAGADRPGVFSARAALRALQWGIAVGGRVALVGWGAALDRAATVLGPEQVLGPFAPTQVSAVEGRPRVEAIVVDGRRLPCDALVFDGVRSAAYAVAAQAGGEVAWDGRGFVVLADDDGRTHAPGTFALGRVTGRLFDRARAEAVGRCAAKGAGLAPSPPLVRPPPRSAPAPLPAQASDKIVVCRCEDVTLHDLEEAVQSGYRDIESVKRYTGFGTGWCQGKQCVALCGQMIASAGGDDAERPFTARPPVRPLALARLAKLVDEPEPR